MFGCVGFPFCCLVGGFFGGVACLCSFGVGVCIDVGVGFAVGLQLVGFRLAFGLLFGCSASHLV